MGDIEVITGQLLDRLSDLVLGPVHGSVLATASAGTVVIPRGHLGALPNGRLVRVRKSTKVTTSATPVPCRLLFLTPAFPKAGNFQVLPASTVVTWTSPPAGIAATGTVAADFTPGPLANSLRLGSVGLFHRPSKDHAELFAAGAQGDVQACLYAPRARRLNGGGLKQRRQTWEVTWKLHVGSAKVDSQAEGHRLVDRIFDALCSSVQGGRVGSGTLRLDEWTPLGDPDTSRVIYEATLVALLWTEGRVFVQPTPPGLPATPTPFDLLGVDVRGADFGAQPQGFNVTQDVAT